MGSRGVLAASRPSHGGTPKGSYPFYAHRKHSHVEAASFLTWMRGGEEHGDVWWRWCRVSLCPQDQRVPWLSGHHRAYVSCAKGQAHLDIIMGTVLTPGVGASGHPWATLKPAGLKGRVCRVLALGALTLQLPGSCGLSPPPQSAPGLRPALASRWQRARSEARPPEALTLGPGARPRLRESEQGTVQWTQSRPSYTSLQPAGPQTWEPAQLRSAELGPPTPK